MDFVIRDMVQDDIPQINAIYNEAIKLGYATAHTDPIPVDYHLEWFKEHIKDKNPVIVVCIGNMVVGWNALSNYRSGRKGLAKVKETSYYIHKDYWKQGLASLLMERMIERAKLLGVETLVTFIMDVNEISIRLMEKFDFQLWGRLPGVLSLPGGQFDHMIFGRKI
jgi:phosphinothricin acetyltransferase